MNGAINGFAYNGSAFPNWVVRAVVAATAAATVTAGSVRIAYGNVLADAAVVVTLTQTHVVAGRAQATAGANSATAPNIIYAGRSNTTANAIGLAAMRRDVFAFADGDGTATGFALSSSKIGEASGTAASTLVSCNAHEILPGAVLGTVFATGAQATGLATRYPTVLAQAGVEYTRAESRIKLNGESIWRHDGFVPAGNVSAGCSASVPNDRMAIIATIGAFMFADATGTAKANIKFPGAASEFGECVRITCVGSYLRAAAVSATAGATDTTVPIRTTQGAASGVGEASHLQLRPLVNYRGAVNALAEATLIQPVPCLRTAAARATTSAEAYLATFTGFGTQHRGIVVGLCTASVSSIQARQTYKVSASGSADASRGVAILFGTQHRGEANTRCFSVGLSAVTYVVRASASGSAIASSPGIPYLTNWAARANVVAQASGLATPATQWYWTAAGNAAAYHDAIQFGTQNRAQATTTARATGSASARHIFAGLSTGAATSSGTALAFANSDVRAPEDRYMVVPTDDRVMIVGFEERLMVAA